ncbi:hypothetical protein ACI797_09435 [Geodermatophilus sp. SYSU D00691]
MPVVPPDPALRGRWQRTLLIRPDGTCDTSAAVTWLQAGSYYVDLRLPVDPTATEGFAGRLRADGRWTCWERVVDLRPGPTPDEGLLEPDGPDALVETGRHEAYVERWARRTGPDLPCCAVELRDTATGAPAVLVRVGDDVAWATDAEVALGTVGADGAVVRTASSRPARAVASLDLVADGAGLREITTDPAGTPLLRRWSVVATEGSAAALPVRRPRPVVPEVRTA